MLVEDRRDESMVRLLSVVVPTYNEVGNLAELMARMAVSLKGIEFEVVFVDDGSPDGTAEVAEALGRTYRNTKVIRRLGRRGLASAVLDSLRYAEGDSLAVMDADLQHPPELLRQMYEALRKGCDLVVASRYVKGGRVQDSTVHRRVVSRAATGLAHMLLPRTSKIEDPMSGYFLLKREVIDGARLNPRGYKLLLEILAKGKWSSVVEIPYTFEPRLWGKSKLGLGEIWDYVRHLCMILGSARER